MTRARKNIATVSLLSSLALFSGVAFAAAPPQGVTTLRFIAPSGGYGVAVGQVAALFNRENKHVQVKVLVEGSNQIDVTERLVATSSNPPDMLYWPVGPGYGEIRAARLGILANLTPVYDKYHLFKILPSSTKGEEINGKMYNVNGWIGAQPYVFYNATMFKKLHITPPTTSAQLIADAHKVRAAGYETIGLGSAHQWPAVHLMSILIQRELPLGAYNKLKLSWDSKVSNPTKWTNPRVVAAFKTLQTWAKAGVFAPGFSSLTNAETTTLFASGKALMQSIPLGAWTPKAIQSLIGHRFQVGIFQYPQLISSIPTYQNVALANGEFSVPERSWKHNQAAITQWIRFYLSVPAQKIFAANGFPPEITTGISKAYLTKQVGPLATKVLGWIKEYGAEQNLDGWLAAQQKSLVARGAEEIVAGTATPLRICQQLQALTNKLRHP